MNKIFGAANRHINTYLFLSFLLFTLLGAFLYFYLVPWFITTGFGSPLFYQLLLAFSLLFFSLGLYSILRLTILLFLRQIDSIEN